MTHIHARRMVAVLAAFMWLAAVPVTAKIFKDAGVAAPFLKIGQGARASAMGGAFTAVADDSTAVFWNPAGLAQINRVEAQFTHNEWISDFRQEYFGVVLPFSGGWGIAWSLIDLGDFAGVDANNNPTGNTLTINDQLLMIGYGRGFFDDTLLVGVSAKTVKEDLDDGISGKTTSFDLGVIGLPLWDYPRLAVAGVVENIGGELTGFKLPLTMRIGASCRLSGLLRPRSDRGERAASYPRGGVNPLAPYSARGERREPSRSLPSISRAYSRYPWEVRGVTEDALLVAVDLRVPQRGRAELRAGAEYWLAIVAVRAGYRYRFFRNDLGGLSGLTVGLGVRGRGFQFDYGFDYSYAPLGELGSASRFTVSVTF